MGTITDKLNKLAETKSAIKTAIVNKGVAVSDSDTFASYADKIASISGGGTPTEGIYGVFIYDTNGNLTKPEEWDTANNDLAVGVAVIDENCAFVIGKEASESKTWSSKLYGTKVSGIVTTTNSDIAKIDYAGEANSSVVRGLTSGEDNAFNWAYGKTITVNGTTLYGYIGALGEWQTAYNNKSSIDSALSKIGGTAMLEGYHWSSTQYCSFSGSENAFIYVWGSDLVTNSRKYNNNYVRVFYHLDYPSSNSIITNINREIIAVNGNVTLSGTIDLDADKNPNIIILDGKSTLNFDNATLITNATEIKYIIKSIREDTTKTPYGILSINAPNCTSISIITPNYNGEYLSNGNFKIILNLNEKITNLDKLLYATNSYIDLELNNIGNIVSCRSMYEHNITLYKLSMPFNSSYCTDFQSILSECYLLQKWDNVSLKSLNTEISDSYFTGYSNMDNLRYVLLKDFGTGSSCTSANFSYWPKWGIEDETVPLSKGGRQSLIDTLITYSYDRATAGYSTCTVTLHSNTKALLTEDEIAQITAKGYTLA